MTIYSVYYTKVFNGHQFVAAGDYRYMHLAISKLITNAKFSIATSAARQIFRIKSSRLG